MILLDQPANQLETQRMSSHFQSTNLHIQSTRLIYKRVLNNQATNQLVIQRMKVTTNRRNCELSAPSVTYFHEMNQLTFDLTVSYNQSTNS